MKTVRFKNELDRNITDQAQIRVGERFGAKVDLSPDILIVSPFTPNRMSTQFAVEIRENPKREFVVSFR